MRYNCPNCSTEYYKRKLTEYPQKVLKCCVCGLITSKKLLKGVKEQKLEDERISKN